MNHGNKSIFLKTNNEHFQTKLFHYKKIFKEHLTSLLKSTSVADNIQSLRYILCRNPWIIRLYFRNRLNNQTSWHNKSRTNKLINEYLLYYFLTTADDKRKLLVVNPTIKDIIDMEDITVNYLVDFSTSSIIQTYLPHFKKNIAEGTSKKVYDLTHNCDKIFNTGLVRSVTPDFSSVKLFKFSKSCWFESSQRSTSM